MKKFGDRRDGKRVRDIHGMQNIMIDFKPNRCDSTVYMNSKIDMTNFVKSMNKKKKEIPGLTYFHGLVCVLAKAVYSRPFMNRFIAGRTMYMHNDVSFASSIKVEFEDSAVEALVVIKVNPDDTLEEISKGMSFSNKASAILFFKPSSDFCKILDFLDKSLLIS